MKLFQNSNKLLIIFFITLFVINVIQSYTTELLQDESYYWAYSNFLNWGYFDHPPMVAIWITISKLFFSSGELSVRFFSTITLPISFYITWLLIEHPKKKEYTWLFILLVSTTSLFNVYGFITVPDTPLLFFMAFFLLGYKKYLEKKSLFSYILLTLSIVGMMYSKYQAALIVVFVLLSNLKVLKDYKIWLMTITVIVLYFPHLYWQYLNDYASFKYHLIERSSKKSYKFENSMMLFTNMMAIIGFSFPILYYAFFKNLKNKDLFQKALNFLVIGFIGFFFVSTFKGKTQAQWIVPISISLIVISFNYLIDHKEKIKLFLWLACTTLIITVVLRFIMANENLSPKQLEMHGNKKWVTDLDTKLGDRKPLFLNSFQNTSLYWFYTNKMPFQYNVWHSRKNHYDLFDYNKNISEENIVEISKYKHKATDSIIKKNNKNLYLRFIKNYQKEGVSIKNDVSPLIIENQLNHLKIDISNPNNIDLSKLKLQIIFRDEDRHFLKQENSKYAKAFGAKLTNNNQAIEFTAPKFNSDFKLAFIQIIGKLSSNETLDVRMGFFPCNFKENNE